MSLEGLNALIQLESAKLESFKASSQSFQTVQQDVRQRGLQAAQSRQNVRLQVINANYEKDVAAAEVRRIEKKLARQQKAEQLAGITALGVAGIELVSGLWDLGRDLGGAQKLGDIQSSLQSPPLDPSNTEVLVQQHNNSAADTVYMVGNNGDGSETVQTFIRNGNGAVPPSSLRSATITGEDKVRILGDERYRDMSFAEIQREDPDAAKRLIDDKAHSLSRAESEGFAGVVNSAPELHDYRPMVNQSMLDSGRVNDSGFIDKVGQVGGGLTRVLVQTAQASVPFFQAYLKARSATEELRDQLEAAQRKLEAAVRKLNAIQGNIDEFQGRGA